MFTSRVERPQAVSRVPLATIDAVVSARLGTTRVSGNAQPAVFNRQVAMYLAKHVGRWSTTWIGKFYNGRDHSTVCYALKRIEALREADLKSTPCSPAWRTRFGRHRFASRRSAAAGRPTSDWSNSLTDPKMSL